VGSVSGSEGKSKEAFFFKKRTKKPLLSVGCWLEKRLTAHKSFLLLFFKKEGPPKTRNAL
jgi:hypothetical protein